MVALVYRFYLWLLSSPAPYSPWASRFYPWWSSPYADVVVKELVTCAMTRTNTWVSHTDLRITMIDIPYSDLTRTTSTPYHVANVSFT